MTELRPLHGPERARNTKHGSALDGWERYRKPAKFTRIYRRFPGTITLVAPYIFLIIPPAIAFGNADVWFLIAVATLAVAGTLLPELFLSKARLNSPLSTNASQYGVGLFSVSLFAIIVSSVVDIAAAYGGKGSVAVQIGIADAGSGIFGTLDSITGGWAIAGTGILFAAYIGGQCSRQSFFSIIAYMLVSEGVVAYFTQITAPLLSKFIFLSMLLLLFGLIRIRVVIIGILIALIVWPIMFDIRNELRTAEGVVVSEEVDAFDRIRFDLQFARAKELEVPLEIEVPSHLQHPSVVDVLRFGLIPRFLDPDREIISTGQVINVALGGTITSAYTFGPVTTAYVLEGPIYLLAFYFLLSVYVNLVWRKGTKITPTRLVLLSLVFSGPLGWFATFPDATIGMLQSLVSCLPILFLLFILRILNHTSHGKVRLKSRNYD